MANRGGGALTFIVPGEEQAIQRGAARGATEVSPPELPIALPGAELKQSVRVGALREGGAGPVRVRAVPDQDVVVLDIANGPALVLHPEHARELMLAQSPQGRARSAGDGAGTPTEVQVPLELVWRGLEDAVPSGATRGGLGRVLLKAIHVVTGGTAAKLAASEVAKAVDGQVTPGVYQLSRASLPKLKTSGSAPLKTIRPSDETPILVLIHGTFSDTSGTFGKLWAEHPVLVSALFDHYGDRVYALDHPTLGASPIANARMLAEALPNKARVHVVTHSRGGLVAEVLARVCASPDLTDQQLEPFTGKDAADRETLKALAALVKRKAIRVERIVRVACPARGTLLASKRLDAYLSVFRWSLQLAGIPVAPELLGFLHAVAQQRHEPKVLPGLAAQIPDSALIRWLHDVDAPIPGQLRVVAGDLQGDSVASWLKTLLTDAFYWTDHDLVVQTRSMYGGAPRQEAGFVLDQGGRVSHFSYFHNERTAGAIVNALVQDAPAGFRTIGPLSWAGESSTGSRAAILTAVDGKPGREKPALFLLPGILGSNLKVDGRRIWLGWGLINGLERLAYRRRGVEPDGPIDRVYDDLGRFLAQSHEVIEFGYDWRKPIELEAVRLAEEVTKALDARAETGQPVRILAHSMGGVLARTMALERPNVWQRMMEHPGARMLMLGTPNGGSWAPMQVLSGDDNFGNLLAIVGAPFRTADARKLMAEFPGFLQLQAGLLDPERKLSSEATWKALADEDIRRLKEHSWWHRDVLQLDSYTWGVPTQQVLDQAVALRKRLDRQREEDLPKFKHRLLLVTGSARFTPDGYTLGDRGLSYLDAEGHGDGRVTQSAAQLPGVLTWRLDCAHGDLPSHRDAFDAYLELLQQGTTDLLKTETASVRGAAPGEPAEVTRVPNRPSRGRSNASPPEGPADLLGPTAAAPLGEGVEGAPALRITVHNGNLAFVREPLMLGHYRSMRLTGTERVMDRLIGDSMSLALNAGLYPDEAGSHQVFANTRVPEGSPRQLPRPEAVIVVGLGHEGKLEATDIMETVRQGVLAWSQRLAERPGARPPLFDLAATLIGSGGKGIEVGQSARFIAKGVREANRRLGSTWPRVGHLHLIELYLDRAVEALRELKIEASAAPKLYDVTATIVSGTGALVRPIDSGYRGSDYDFMSALTRGSETTEAAIEYTLDTSRARGELRDQITQKALVRGLVETASNSKLSDRRLGVTLCRLLIPLKLDAFLAGTTELLIELDDGTVGIPWELLDTGASEGGDDRPWSIRSKLVRRLRTSTFREDVVDTDVEARALVIGEPAVDTEVYPPLPGAREEAEAVARLLRGPEALGPELVKSLIAAAPGAAGPDASEVINSLLERRGGRSGVGQGWRIVHVAGHGEQPLGNNPRGVVLSDGLFLGPREVESMREVPELVFVNCCHIGASDPARVLQQESRNLGKKYDRVAFAAGLAKKLIDLGVRCVVVAGWAVDDTAASTFATTFYQAILAGRRFMDAVAEAREAAYHPDDKTWAAYQCYGDPDWTLRIRPGDDREPASSPGREFTGVASPIGLTLALQTLVVQSETQGTPPDAQITKLRHLESRYAGSWGALGHVAAAFGDAWQAAGDRDKAIEWYDKALKANDGSASVRAGEQLGNVLARRAWEGVERAQRKVDLLERSQAPQAGPAKPRTRRPRRPSAELRKASAEVRAAATKARAPMRKAIGLLQRVAALQPTMERESLLGSAYKRQAMIAEASGQQTERNRGIRQMRDHYQRALEEGRKAQLGNLFYPGLNLMAAELVLRSGQRNWQGFDPALVADVERTLDHQMREDPDFWSAAGIPELLLYQAIAARDVAGRVGEIIGAYQDLYRRVRTGWRWASVYDQIRFVLSGYELAASATERKAAERVRVTVREFAMGSPKG